MNGLVVFVILCWIALGLLPLSLGGFFFVYLLRYAWLRAGHATTERAFTEMSNR